MYLDMNEAYPDFTDPNFNGGNLVVGPWALPLLFTVLSQYVSRWR